MSGEMLVLLILWLHGHPVIDGHIDTHQPIVKISPALKTSSMNDYFSYSVTAHQLFADSTNMTFEEILSQTLVIVGAPRGIYPGGLEELPLDWRACLNYTLNAAECTTQKSILMNYTREEIQSCYDNIVTGLVYTCSLGKGDCTALLGNGDSTSLDGLLFDSIGDYDDNCRPMRSKYHQQMGSLVYSSGDYFMACAPLYRLDTRANNIQPFGRCVYSNRTLTGFSDISSCTEGSPTTIRFGGHCLTGFSGLIQETKLAVTLPFIGVGQTNVYSNINQPSPPFQSFQPTSTSDNYFGYFTTNGFISSQTTKDYITSQPRYNASSGRVYVHNSNLMLLSNNTLSGEQVGEYFGYSIAASDLNGDGWDDLVVGAPYYSDLSLANIRPSLGRLFVFINNERTLQLSAIIEGYTAKGQFSTSITSLGDLNNDGYEDIAVGAPFEGSGVVYIYHGQSMDEEGSIINKTYQQRIDGASFVSQVSNLTSVSGFGFSISGSVDVDQNQYRDLVIGAFDSQSVFVLRAIPVAIAKITLNVTISEINLEQFNCVFANNSINCFDVEVCTEYYGRGLESGFSTKYELKEVTQRNIASRLFFTTPSSSSTIRDVTYAGINMPFCENVTVYIKNETSTSDISDLELTAEVLSIARPDPLPLNTHTLPTNEANRMPLIQSSPTNIFIRIASRCDEICDSDLSVQEDAIIYRNENNGFSEDQTKYVIGDSSFVDFTLAVSNEGEDAFNSYVNFTLQRDFFVQIQSLNASEINCVTMSEDNLTINVTCSGLPSPFIREVGQVRLSFRLTVNNTVRGDEGNSLVSVTVAIPQRPRNQENTSLLYNNHIDIQIPFKAVTNYQVDIFFSSSNLTYYGDRIFTGTMANDLGDPLMIRATLNNNGPSPYYGNMVLYIPAKEINSEFYYYYPAKLTFRPTGNHQTDKITCDESQLNPDNFMVNSATTRRRRKRQTVHSSFHQVNTELIRKTRQLVNTNNNNLDLDCSVTPSMCIQINCSVMLSSGGGAIAIVEGYIDERFFMGKTTTYSLRAYVSANVTDGYTDFSGSISNSNATVNLIGPQEDDITIYIIIIVPIVAAFIFIIILAVILYCLGFFRKKKKQLEAEEEEEVDDNPDQKPDDIDEIKNVEIYQTTL